MKLAITQCPLWTHLTPSYSVSLLAACAKEAGFDVVRPELEIRLFRHVADDERLLWESVRGSFWDSDAGPEALFARYRDDFFRPLLQGLVDEGVTVFAFSVNHRALAMTRCVVGLLETIAPDAHVILGGPSSFAAPHLLSDMPGVDAVCLGEGERAFPAYLRALADGAVPETFPGFALRHPDGTLTNGGRAPVAAELDALPFPDFAALDLALYHAPGVLPTAMSRGCLQRCAYCAESPHFGTFRSRSGASMFAEVQHHLRATGRTSLRLLLNDSLVNGDLAALEGFADALIEGHVDVRWGGMAVARGDMTPALLTKLKRAGCGELSFGVESGSPEVLRAMRKRMHTVESAKQVLHDAKAAGIFTTVYLLLGFPGETERHFHETVQFVRDAFDDIDCLMANQLLVLEGSKLATAPERFGLDPSACGGGDFCTVDGTSTPEVRRLRQELLYLLFQEKMALLSPLGGHGADPVARLRGRVADLQLAVKQLSAVSAEMDAMRRSRPGQSEILSLWRDGVARLWACNDQLRPHGEDAFESTGGDPFLVGPTLNAGPGTPRYVKLVLRHELSESAEAQVFWRHPADRDFSEAQSVRFRVPPSRTPGGYERVYLDLRERLPRDKAELPIVQLRLDPLERAGAVHIRDIEVF